MIALGKALCSGYLFEKITTIDGHTLLDLYIKYSYSVSDIDDRLMAALIEYLVSQKRLFLKRIIIICKLRLDSRQA
jgi:hypothetical protein